MIQLRTDVCGLEFAIGRRLRLKKSNILREYNKKT